MSEQFQRQWITALPLEECRKRIAREDEEATIWATKYQQRTTAKVWQVDGDLAGFEIQRVPKSSLQFGVGNGIKAVGILQRASAGGTQVFVETKISLLMQVFYPIFTLIIWGALSAMARSLLLTQPLFMTAIASMGILIVLVLYSFFFFDMERRRLLRIVEAALDR